DRSNAESNEDKESHEAESEIISTDTSNAESNEDKESPEAESDIISTDTSNAESNEDKESPEAESNFTNSLNEVQTSLVEKHDDEINIETSESENLEKMILSTGIRVGTPVKTKSMSRYIVRANPEGLYILDISKTLYRIDVAAKFIGRTNIAKVAITSAREYGKKPVEKFCEATGATPILGRFMPGTFTNPSLPKYMEPEIVIVTDPQADQQAVIEATRAGVPVLAISNSDNVISKVDLVIPANNRGRKALATVYWLLAREVMKKQGKIKSDKEMKVTIDDFETKLVEVV
ncbi:MAG TPA: 30S ribosomal protein S2, partial [Nitrososphaeraceae archaeon]|nr:30S ribosomal protein S2 [Nitrososphaeraceae archaeon]